MRRVANSWQSGRVTWAHCLVICGLLLSGCPEVQESVPPQLRGTWVAEGDLYAGRSMEIGRQQIAFYSGDGEFSEHPIRGVLAERLAGETRFALDYLMDNGGEYRLQLIIDHESGQLRLAGRRQVVWTREAAG